MRSITMKTSHFMIALAVLSGMAFGQPSRGPASVKNPVTIRLTNEGGAFPVMRESLDSGRGSGSYLIHLDAAKVDTGWVQFNVLKSGIYSTTDTIGVASMTCKDSTGTDTASVILRWQGNPRPDGNGVWEKMDSVNYIGSTVSSIAGIPISNIFANKRKEVVNTGGYSLIRFNLRNVGASGILKATCKDVVLIRRERVGWSK